MAVAFAAIVMNLYLVEPIRYVGSPNTTIQHFHKKCDSIASKYMGGHDKTTMQMHEMVAMFTELQECNDRQGVPRASATTKAPNTAGGFGSWLPLIFTHQNRNEGKD